VLPSKASFRGGVRGHRSRRARWGIPRSRKGSAATEGTSIFPTALPFARQRRRGISMGSCVDPGVHDARLVTTDPRLSGSPRLHGKHGVGDTGCLKRLREGHAPHRHEPCALFSGASSTRGPLSPTQVGHRELKLPLGGAQLAGHGAETRRYGQRNRCLRASASSGSSSSTRARGSNGSSGVSVHRFQVAEVDRSSPRSQEARLAGNERRARGPRPTELCGSLAASGG